jgi:hypothetical protein
MSYISVQLRQEVIKRVEGCCEYCLVSQEDEFFKFPIDHIIAQKHGGTSTSANLCLSCPDCNAFKGSDIASIDSKTRQLTPLFNPREQKWDEHFHFQGAIIEPRTPVGRVTVVILQLNRPERITDRLLLIEANRYPCSLKK